MILGPDGRPYSQSQLKIRPQVDLPPIPLYQRDRDYVAEGLTPQRLAALFCAADQGDMLAQAELFDQMLEKDAHLLAEYQKRCLAAMGVEFQIEPADTSDKAEQAAQLAREIWNGLDLPPLLVALQDAVGSGFAAAEIHWELDRGRVIPTGFSWLPQKRFRFTREGQVLLLSEASQTGEEIPPYKTVFHRPSGLAGDPRHPRVFRCCAWLYLFKNYSLKDWVVFAEIYGQPLRIGKYPRSANEEEVSILRRALRQLGADGAAVIPEGAEILFQNALTGAANGEVYERLASFCERGMSKAILGQTLSSEVGSKGSYAAAKVHDEVRRDLMEADAWALAATLRQQLLAPLIGYNLGWDVPVPQLRPILAEATDLKALAETLQMLAGGRMNLPIPHSFLRDRFGIPEPEGEEPVTASSAAASTMPLKASPAGQYLALGGSESAEPFFSVPQQLLEDVVDAFVMDLVETRSVVQDKIQAAVDSATSLAELQQKLLAVYPTLDAPEFVDRLSRAMLAAHLTGRKYA